MKCFCRKKRWKKGILCGVAALLAVYLCLCLSMRLTARDTALDPEECMLYYIVNVDGMKGLGHSILMLVDQDGCGTVYSFNGMQRSLWESLLGQSGVGKMSMGIMSAQETAAFLRTGDLKLDGDQLSGNYDVALYRPISPEEYRAIAEQAAPYWEAQERFADLYEKWVYEQDEGKKAEYEQDLEQLSREESLPLYRIYTYNCDDAARGMAAPADPILQEYTRHLRRMTPSGNLKAFGKMAEDWGVMTLGRQSLAERIMMFLMIL